MRDVNEMTNMEIDNIVRKIRRKAEQQGETITKGHDNYNSLGFMVSDAHTGNIIAGEGFTIDLESLAKMYDVTC